MKKKFISYKDDENQTIKGFFEIINERANYIEFKSGSNKIKIPWNRVLKVKESLKGGKV